MITYFAAFLLGLSLNFYLRRQKLSEGEKMIIVMVTAATFGLTGVFWDM